MPEDTADLIGEHSLTMAAAKRISEKSGAGITGIIELIFELIERCTNKEQDFTSLARKELTRMQIVGLRRHTRRALRDDGQRATRALTQSVVEHVRSEAATLESDDLCTIYCECCEALCPADHDVPM